MIQDKTSTNNTDEKLDLSKENLYEGVRYYFPSAYDPTDDTELFVLQKASATARLKMENIYYIISWWKFSAFF